VTYQEKRSSGKFAGSVQTGETAGTEPTLNITTDTGSQPTTRKDKPTAKKRKGEVKKLLAEPKARPTRHASAREKDVRPPTIELDDEVSNEEPTTKRTGKRAETPASQAMQKKKASGRAKLPPVRVSEKFLQYLREFYSCSYICKCLKMPKKSQINEYSDSCNDILSPKK
jgi:hypothetical protein